MPIRGSRKGKRKECPEREEAMNRSHSLSEPRNSSLLPGPTTRARAAAERVKDQVSSPVQDQFETGGSGHGDDAIPPPISIVEKDVKNSGPEEEEKLGSGEILKQGSAEESELLATDSLKESNGFETSFERSVGSSFLDCSSASTDSNTGPLARLPWRPPTPPKSRARSLKAGKDIPEDDGNQSTSVVRELGH